MAKYLGNKRVTAFTLIELLVVIAIISIIAAILFPVFATAREKARQASCESNEKQIALAILQYSQDNDEFYVPCYNSALKGYDYMILPYVGGVAAGTKPAPWEVCPDDTVVRPNATTRSYSLNAGPNFSTASILRSGPCGINGLSLIQSQVQCPAQLILVAERFGYGNSPGGSNSANVDWPNIQLGPLYSGGPDFPAPAHSGGWNYAFCDGHVKWYQPQQTIGSPGVGDCNVNYGTLDVPCGMWTEDPND